jgi:hypothetical protein
MPALELSDEQVIALFEGLSETQQKRVMARLGQSSPKKRPRFGSAKNDIIFIAEDFDAPLYER